MVTQNTGPKGVILDSQVAGAEANQYRLRAQQQRSVQMVGRAPTTTTVLEDEAEKERSLILEEEGGVEDVPSQEILQEYSKTKTWLLEKRNEADGGEDDSDLGSELEELLDLDMTGERKREDMSVLQKWREQRLQELRANADVSSMGRLQTFGMLKDADSDGYLNALESGDCSQVVILLLFDESQESKMISSLLSQIAQQYITINFIRMHYLETEMDKVGIPAILAYKNHGDQIIANIARVVDELPPISGLTAATLESVLKR
ncbi:hypothetical protein V1520DRAFT_342481 [Lipomyces starkeyi]|uniref:Phosducin domain-containing protein n=1 Tax=Lipomyces starkeyi NRRL Y-11557 TaxID=675824 RepID=A0A1E3QFQ1_LIPST|nr:hypothetical protein LIPSTDRAFT_362 [Lipomyces starkeyi NRRL Y-11557]